MLFRCFCVPTKRVEAIRQEYSTIPRITYLRWAGLCQQLPGVMEDFRRGALPPFDGGAATEIDPRAFICRFQPVITSSSLGRRRLKSMQNLPRTRAYYCSKHLWNPHRTAPHRTAQASYRWRTKYEAAWRNGTWTKGSQFCDQLTTRSSHLSGYSFMRKSSSNANRKSVSVGTFRII